MILWGFYFFCIPKTWIRDKQIGLFFFDNTILLHDNF